MPAIEILKILNSIPRLSPVLIASKTGIPIQRVRNLLTVLLELKVVETASRGLYQITDLGRYVLDKQLEVSFNE